MRQKDEGDLGGDKQSSRKGCQGKHAPRVFTCGVGFVYDASFTMQCCRSNAIHSHSAATLLKEVSTCI